VLGDKLIYVVSAEKNLYAIDNKGGTQAWYNKLEANTNISPSFGNENIFVERQTKYMHFLLNLVSQIGHTKPKILRLLHLTPKKQLYTYLALYPKIDNI